MELDRGAWVAQLFKHLTLGFSSSHDLGVVRWSLESGSALSVEPAEDSLSHSRCSSLHLKKKKKKQQKKNWPETAKSFFCQTTEGKKWNN